MNCDIFLSILSQKISDKKLLNLVRARLCFHAPRRKHNQIIFDSKSDSYEKTLLELPQGVVDSPYLLNIYLMGRDEFVLEKLGNKIQIENDRIKGPNLINFVMFAAPIPLILSTVLDTCR